MGERRVGFTEVGEVVSELRDESAPQTIACIKKEQTKITERATSVDKNLGLEENVEEVATFKTAPQEGKVVSTDTIKPKYTGQAIMTEKSLGITNLPEGLTDITDAETAKHSASISKEKSKAQEL